MIFNEIAEQGQLSQLLQRRLNMLGSAPAPSLMPEIAPTLTMENDRPEWGYLKGEVLASKYDSVTAVAAQYSLYQLYVPSNRPTIAVVTRIICHIAVGFSVVRLVGIGGGLAGWAGRTTATRDFRFAGQNTGVILERTNNAALPSRFPDIVVLGAVGQEFNEPIIVTPGTALGIVAQSVNTTPVFSLHWYERNGLPGELG